MSDDDLWQAVLAAPDDDGPRLVYADALLARGDPHGELIVLQCSPHSAARNERERELVGDERLLGELATFVHGTFVRGFLDEIAVRKHHLDDRRIDVLLDSPHAQLCRELRIVETRVTSSQLERLVRGMPRLRHLRLARAGIDHPSVAALVLAADRLETLSLEGNTVDDEALGALSRARWPRLAELDLMSNAFTAAGIATLLAADLPVLAHLDLSSNDLADLATLAGARELPALRTLHAGWSNIGDGIAALRDARWLATVEELDLQGNDLTDAPLLRFFESPYLGALQSVGLDHNPLSGAAEAEITAWFDRARRERSRRR